MFVPMKRGGTADEVARAILWLLSDEAVHDWFLHRRDGADDNAVSEVT